VNKFSFVVITITYLLLSTSSAWAQNKIMPQPPQSCFKTKKYCGVKSVIPFSDGFKNVISVSLFATVNVNKYPVLEDLVDRVTNFDLWPTYTKKSKQIKYAKSMELPVTYDEDGTEILVHYADYKISGPGRGIFKIKTHIREVANYKRVERFDGAEISYLFENDMKKTHRIPGEDDLKGAEGIKYKKGQIHIGYNSDKTKYILSMKVNSVPKSNFAPETGAKYTELALLDLLKGLLNVK
jgi:hypothetical protein